MAEHPRDPYLVAFAGDWHGDTEWALRKIRESAAAGVRTILHVGDFGIWPGFSGGKYLQKVNRDCKRFGVEILVTPGNHEDWGRLRDGWDRPEALDADGRLLPLRKGDHVAVLPRGWRWTMAGRSFVSLGGAASLDYQFRTEDEDWWADEAITNAEADEVAGAGYADVMIVHETPAPPYAVPQVDDLLASNPMDWTDRALAYSADSRAKVTRAMLAVRPRLLVHGHIHLAGEASVTLPGADHATTVWSLAANGHAGNTRVLDLATL